MDKEKKTNRGEEVKESLLDAGAESATNWGINFINENLPKAMDSTVSKIKELITSLGHYLARDAQVHKRTENPAQ